MYGGDSRDGRVSLILSLCSADRMLFWVSNLCSSDNNFELTGGSSPEVLAAFTTIRLARLCSSRDIMDTGGGAFLFRLFLGFSPDDEGPGFSVAGFLARDFRGAVFRGRFPFGELIGSSSSIVRPLGDGTSSWEDEGRGGGYSSSRSWVVANSSSAEVRDTVTPPVPATWSAANEEGMASSTAEVGTGESGEISESGCWKESCSATGSGGAVGSMNFDISTSISVFISSNWLFSVCITVSSEESGPP